MTISEKHGAYWTGCNDEEIVFETYDEKSDLLGVVFHHPLDFFRSVVFRKRSGEPQFIGLWWHNQDDGPICTTLSESKELLLNRLQKIRQQND
jgi:hypothetical protein